MIVQHPDPALREVSVAWEPDEGKLARSLRAAVASSERPAAGLAAPQIGVNVRAFVDHAGVFYANPRVIRKSTETDVMEEGCLSFPASVLVPIERHLAIMFVYDNEFGASCVSHAHGLDARVAQNEIDHLDGVLIVDYLKED